MLKKLIIYISIMLIFSALFSVDILAQEQIKLPEIPERTVKFASLPFLDHAQGYIGAKQGWFREAGIELDPPPYGRVILPPQRAALHLQGSVEISSGATGAAVSLQHQLPGLALFAIADIFQGYAILMRPVPEFKTYKEMVDNGMEPQVAFNKALQQLKGAKWATDLSPAGQLFVDAILNLSGLTSREVEMIEVEAARVFELAVTGRVDFATPGAPGRVELQQRGFEPLLTVREILQNLPENNLQAYQCIFFDGWLTNRSVWENDPELILRMASVIWRINQFIVDKPKEALELYLPYYNRISGRDISIEEGMFIITELDPFITFMDQGPIFNDPNHALYHKKEVEAKLIAQIEKGVYEKGEITFEDISIAPEVWKRMNEYKKKYDDVYSSVASEVESIESIELKHALTRAENFYDAFNFLDAYRYIKAISETL
jgi:ABC-type nitrate/sulfonate/bicarbonate transport system substrate-binding protein